MLPIPEKIHFLGFMGVNGWEDYVAEKRNIWSYAKHLHVSKLIQSIPKRKKMYHVTWLSLVVIVSLKGTQMELQTGKFLVVTVNCSHSINWEERDESRHLMFQNLGLWVCLWTFCFYNAFSWEIQV